MNAQITALLQEQLARKVRRQLKKIKRVLARLPGHPSKPRPKPKQLKKLQAELDNLITQLALLQQEDWETSTQFPAEEGHLAPTALGNVLSAVSSNVWQRYRIDIAALWPYMEGVIPKESSLGKRLDDDRATLDFTINLAFLLLVFTAEYLLFRLVYLDALGQTLLIVAGLLAAYYVLYRTAVGTAKRWGQGVHMAFELHRKALRKQLGLCAPDSRAKERVIWRTASQWLLSGPSTEIRKSAVEYPYRDDDVKKEWPEDDLFEGGKIPKPTPAGAAVTHHSDSVKVEIAVSAEINLGLMVYSPKDGTLPARSVMIYDKRFDYVLLVDNAIEDGDTETYAYPAKAVYAFIQDPRVPWIAEPLGYGGADKGQIGFPYSVHPTGKQKPPQQLMWHLSDVPANASRVLTYSLPMLRFGATTDNASLTILLESSPLDNDDFYKFTVTNGGSKDIEMAILEVYDARFVQSDHWELKTPVTYWLDRRGQENVSDAVRVLGSPPRYRWKLPTINCGASITLEYSAVYVERKKDNGSQ